MSRYFLEVAYKGTSYSGFQVQDNANTIQAEIQQALFTVCRSVILLTGSSRTDAGVHALQNFFHFDYEGAIHPQLAYKLNAVLPNDIAVRHVYTMHDSAHSRFDALSRHYEYRVYGKKDPFIRETAYYFPYTVDHTLLQETAYIIRQQTNFFAFSKTNTAVKHFNCQVEVSEWRREGEVLIYSIQANRFLRGMVRSLTGAQLQVSRGTIEISSFVRLFLEGGGKCRYSLPPTGLFLNKVAFPAAFFGKKP
ncbi:MAG: tRNA pseudouridine synthase A [Chitinophagaceae bacterium]